MGLLQQARDTRRAASIVVRDTHHAWLHVLRARGAVTTRFFDARHPTAQQLGRARSEELFEIERRYHTAILAQPRAELRAGLYDAVNRAIKDFKATHLPERREYGFSPRYIEAHTDLFRGKRVADFGCGYGLSTALLSCHAESVVGIDCAERCIEDAARHHAADPKMRFVRSPSLALPLADLEVDALYSNDVLEHLHPDDARTHLAEAVRVLRPRGVYLLYTPDAASGPHDMTKAFWPQGAGFTPLGAHIHEYSPQELDSALLYAGFDRVEHPDPATPKLVIAYKAG
jgi:SAM-dependent methyltransferase